MADKCMDCGHFLTNGESKGLCDLKCGQEEAQSITYWMWNAFYGSRKACKKFVEKVDGGDAKTKIYIE